MSDFWFDSGDIAYTDDVGEDVDFVMVSATAAIDCRIAGCRWGDEGSARCECS